MKMKNFTIMLKLIFVIVLLFNSITGNTCSCIGYVDEFCYSADTSDYIALVELLDFDDDSAARFKLIENINKEIPDTISVLGADGFNCNLDLTKFEIGDTLIINTNYYSDGSPSTENSNFYNWGIEDCSRHYLEFSSNIVYGKLDTFTDQKEIAFQEFKERLFECYDFTLSSIEINEKSISIYPNPFKNNFWFKSEIRISQINIYNLKGQRIKSIQDNSQSNLNIILENHKHGLYIIEIITPNGIIRSKLLKLD